MFDTLYERFEKKFDRLIEVQQDQNEILIAIYRELVARNKPKPKAENSDSILSVGNAQLQKILARQKEQLGSKPCTDAPNNEK